MQLWLFAYVCSVYKVPLSKYHPSQVSHHYAFLTLASLWLQLSQSTGLYLLFVLTLHITDVYLQILLSREVQPSPWPGVPGGDGQCRRLGALQGDSHIRCRHWPLLTTTLTGEVHTGLEHQHQVWPGHGQLPGQWRLHLRAWQAAPDTQVRR